MKKIILSICLSILMSVQSALAQRWFKSSSLEFGLIGGYSHYNGDLVKTAIEPRAMKPSFGIITRYSPQQRFTVRLSIHKSALRRKKRLCTGQLWLGGVLFWCDGRDGGGHILARLFGVWLVDRRCGSFYIESIEGAKICHLGRGVGLVIDGPGRSEPHGQRNFGPSPHPVDELWA